MNRLGVSFSHLEYMGLWLGLAIVVVAMIRTARVRRAFLDFLGVKELGRGLLGGSRPPVNRPLKTALYLVGTAAIIASTLGPQWGQKANPVRAEGLDLCVAIDISRSMLAEDMLPSRLQYVKNQLSIALPRLGGDRAALVAFAGSAFQAAPLSNDHNALLGFLDPLDPSFVSDQATNLGAAVETCLGALGLKDRTKESMFLEDSAKLVVLLSDGEDTVNEKNGAVARAEQLGVPVFGFVVGTRQGGPMPERDERGQLTGYIRDPSTGKPAISKADSKGLEELASKTGGRVFDFSAGIDAWKDFEKAIADFKRDSKESGTKLDREERFQIPLLIGWVLLIIDFALTETRIIGAAVWLLVFLNPLLSPLLSPGQAFAQMLGARGSGPPPLKAPEVEMPLGRTLNPVQTYKNDRALRSFRSGDLPMAESRFDESLAESSGNFWARFNWATSRLHAAKPKGEGEKPEATKIESATRTLEHLLEELEADGKSDPELKRMVNYQLGQAYEMLEKKPEAFLRYYRSLDETAKDDPLTSHARDNITRLLGKAESQQGGGGGGGGESSHGEGQGGSGQNFTERGNNKPKFQGTDVTESQAQQILESVSGEERQVQQRKAQTDAKEQQSQNRRGNRERGSSSGRDKPW